MRRMSFSATIEQMVRRTKTNTLRQPSSWKGLKAGDGLVAIEKGMGLPKGAKQVELGVIRVISVEVIQLKPEAITRALVTAEGFPDMQPGEFIEFYQSLYRPTPTHARSISFEHIGCTACINPSNLLSKYQPGEQCPECCLPEPLYGTLNWGQWEIEEEVRIEQMLDSYRVRT